MKKVSNWYLIRTFLEIGLTSFGGYTALIAMMREKLVIRDHVIEDELIVDSLAIASVLPGPLAVNCVAHIGYVLRGWLGYWLSITAVLFPSILFMVLLAAFYDQIIKTVFLHSFIGGIIPVVVAIIASVAYNMFQKQVVFSFQKVIFICSLLSALFFKSYLTIVFCMLVGGLVGFLISSASENVKENQLIISGIKSLVFGLVFSILCFIILLFVLETDSKKLFTVFSGVSLTLFGGGYVMISILHDLVVVRHAWLLEDVFVNAIAFGQVTPGPILVSAAFIGYTIDGLWGTILATVGIFVPSSLLMVTIATLFGAIKENNQVKSILNGIRPVIVAFILYSVVVLLNSVELSISAISIVSISFLVLIITRINFLILLLTAGIYGIVFI